MKKRVKLTESNLNRIVKESIKRVLNEVQFGGESLHGNNPEDWAAMKYLRNDRMDNEGETGLYDDDENWWSRNLLNWERNSKNEKNLLDKMDPNDNLRNFEMARASNTKGRNKATRIGKKMGYRYY